MTTDESITDASVGTFLFLVAQIAPPVAMFWLAFGQWGIGVGMIVGLPMLWSVVHIPILLYRKQFPYLLRPVLTLLFALIIAKMGSYYSNEAARYVDQLAHTMHEQCNRDGVCKLPPGDWMPSDRYPTLFHTHTKGLVPIAIVLTFNEYEPNKEPPCAEAPQPKCPGSKPQEPLRFTAFHLTRLVEDHHYNVYGGVGRSLNIPAGSGDD